MTLGVRRTFLRPGAKPRAASLVCLAMQWSQRLDGSSLSKHWRDPED
jgi:hypothetical protein